MKKKIKTIFENYKILGETTDTTEDYSVVESNDLKTISVGGIKIQPGKKSFSHSHPNNDELYYIHSGQGTMTIGEKTFEIKPGNIILYDGKEEHYISNTGTEELYLTMVYNMKPKNK